jgi:RNA polymerase sigma-70 factor, ECF subfamily
VGVAEDPDRARFDAVLREVVEPVRRYLARRVDAATAADVLSETVLVLWRRPGQVPEGAEVAWAIAVARLQLANALRSMRRQERLVARIIAVDPPPEAIPEPADDGVTADLVRRALASLRPAEAELLRLSVWDELSVAEISQVLGISPNAVSIRLHRARRKLGHRIRKLSDRPGHAGVREGGRA